MLQNALRKNNIKCVVLKKIRKAKEFNEGLNIHLPNHKLNNDENNPINY